MAAARLGPADARIPCPLCGGLIHPIAGRCKHCKGDLSALRSSRPSAVATLPALQQASPAPRANGHANGHTPAPSLVHAVAAAAPNGWAAGSPAAAVALDVAQPILPPRPTGRLPTAPARSAWKSWPVIVIVIAVIAIIVAVVLMLWPPERGGDGLLGAAPMAAPERMNTNPMPSVPAPTPRPVDPDPDDPWASPRGGAPAPAPKPPAAPDDVDIDDLDPLPSPGPQITGQSRMTVAIAQHTCARLVACNITQPAAATMCRQIATLPRTQPPSCAAATRCLKAIDELECDVMVGNPLGFMQAPIEDCMDALSC